MTAHCPSRSSTHYAQLLIKNFAPTTAKLQGARVNTQRTQKLFPTIMGWSHLFA
jgi:hypothetical protein